MVLCAPSTMRAILQVRELPASGCQFSSSHSCTISEEGSVEAPDVEVSPQSGFGLCAQGLDLEASGHVSVPHRYNSACEHS